MARKVSLEVFLADPAVPIDTNHLDQGLRVIPTGKKNWLFCWTEIGADRVGDYSECAGDLQTAGCRPLQVPRRRAATHQRAPGKQGR